ncbi:hypothetical protein ACFLRM_04570 [Acidobacteriota bacterium]
MSSTLVLLKELSTNVPDAVVEKYKEDVALKERNYEKEEKKFIETVRIFKALTCPPNIGPGVMLEFGLGELAPIFGPFSKLV